jgi:hypothetical protein
MPHEHRWVGTPIARALVIVVGLSLAVAACTLAPDDARTIADAGPLEAVSCVAGDRCLAIGPARTLVWDGARWSEAPAPSLHVSALDCVAADWCLAVGSTGENPNPAGAVAVWDGTSWVVLPAPARHLARVSCAERAVCVMVGDAPDDVAVACSTCGTTGGGASGPCRKGPVLPSCCRARRRRSAL